MLDEPELASSYPINTNAPTGVYWLCIELPHHSVSRMIAIPTTDKLDDLHLLIQKAVDFDDDHLYQFYLNPRLVEGCANGYPAAETTLAMLNLYKGQRFLYVFDFGASWEFYLTVVCHLPDDTSGKARIVEKVGTAPKQYSGWSCRGSPLFVIGCLAINRLS